ncbi:MAG: hypothetical protein ABW249_10065, partial [Solirubrobacterales bacterium]
GLQARMMSQAMRKLAGNLNRTQTLCIFTNQIREKIGVMFGSPETQPGGRALKFYASQRIDIRRIETLKEGTEAVGNRVRAKIVKNKVAALTPRVELEGQMGEQQVGLQARMMSQAMRKLAGNLNRAKTVCLLTNQIREKIGVMFGSPETQPGGRAMKFYCSQRLDMRRIETLKEGTEAVGNRVRVKVVKNKVAAPFRQAEFDITYGLGISHEGCLLDLALEHDLVQKSGSFFSYGELRLGQGRNNTKQYLHENGDLAGEIEAKLFEQLGIERKPAAPRAVPDAEDAEGAETGEGAEQAAEAAAEPERKAA